MRTLLFFLLLLFCNSTYSQTFSHNNYNRAKTSLNGKWHYIVDPYQAGYLHPHLKPFEEVSIDNSNAFYNNYKVKNPSERVEFDFDLSATLFVPGDWNSQYFSWET